MPFTEIIAIETGRQTGDIAMQIRRQVILWVIFVLYSIAMLWLLFERPTFDIGRSYWEQIEMNVNFIPFKTIRGYIYVLIYRTNMYLIPNAFINLVGNIVAFVPLGCFLPSLCKNLQSFKTLFLSAAAIILVIELIQLFSLRGSCDIDDLILNLVGVVVGFLLRRGFIFCRQKKKIA